MAIGLSINIGLNKVDPTHYGGWDGTLAGCEFDAQDMHGLAMAAGLESPGTLLVTQQATAGAVIQAINDAAAKLGPEDFLFLTYSGHGGQLTDTAAVPDEPDDLDETWVLFDRMLVDDELYALWAGFRSGVRIFVLSDSCHSGSMLRAALDAYAPMRTQADAATKELPRDVQAQTYRQNRELYEGIERDYPNGDNVQIGAHVLEISGCKDNQVSMDGVKNGLFTQTLLQVWNAGSFQGDYSKFHNDILGLMPSSQQPELSTVGAPAPPFVAQRPLTV
jgi:hypothetical protein